MRGLNLDRHPIVPRFTLLLGQPFLIGTVAPLRTSFILNIESLVHRAKYQGTKTEGFCSHILALKKLVFL